MRKIQKQKAESFLETLYEAHDELKKAIEEGTENSIQTVLVILADCQQGMIELGGMIEHSEGEDFLTIRMLEEYCELAYQMHCHLTEEKPDGTLHVAKAYKNLHKLLIQIENSVHNDIKVRREVVFFPYKASMWDSLESVWMAANADRDTDAYVVPIPYYDKNPDGSFREMHYEGDEYPDYVPIINYLEYDFEERMPDMMFIHNPYDAFNYVTSVHPRFYSSNLKQFTEMLVYIPYFILGEIKADDENAMKNIKHFCCNEALRNADKVIVQSEDMRQAYIEVLTREAGGLKEARAYWEKKIEGLGSPKVDKVLNTKKEELEIPEAWMKVIRRPDGSFKKIIFYNTGVTALLENDEKMLKKIESVFQTFRENKDESVLLWRPHPLMESTLVSMRPELWDGYKKLRDTYRKEEWGIYDDTADMDRAVALSDAYYGDMSSIVQLYQKTGKSVVIQNVNMQSGQEANLNCADIVPYGDGLFVLTRDTQSLFLYSPALGKMQLCGIVASCWEDIVFCMTLCKDKLYFISARGENIYIYDIKGEAFKEISLKETGIISRNRYYNACFSHDDKVYLLGDGMLCLDTESNTVKEISTWRDAFKKRYGYTTKIWMHVNACIVEDCLWTALEGDNVLLQYNMLTGEHRFWHVGKRRMQYVTITFDGKHYWLSGFEKCIVRWNKETGEVKEYDNFPDGFEIGNKESAWKELFSCGYFWNDVIYFAPLYANMCISLNARSGQMECVKKIDSNRVCFKIVKIDDKKLYMEEWGLELGYVSLCKEGYLIGEDYSYQPYSLKLGAYNDIISEHVWEQSGFGITVENHPKFMAEFLRMAELKNRDINAGQRECIGKIIFDSVCNT